MIVGKRFKVNIPGTEDPFVCFAPFPTAVLTDSLPSLGWQYPACRDQETDHSLSEDVPGIHRRSVPCQGGALGFTEITTPTVQTVEQWKCKAFVAHFTTYLKINLLEPILYMKMTMWLLLQSLGEHDWDKFFSECSLQSSQFLNRHGSSNSYLLLCYK